MSVCSGFRWIWSDILLWGWWSRCRCRSRSSHGTESATAAMRRVDGAPTDDTRWSATARRRRLPLLPLRRPPSTAAVIRQCSPTKHQVRWTRSRLTAYSDTERLPATWTTDNRSWMSPVCVAFCVRSELYLSSNIVAHRKAKTNK